jgi:short-subunit dehydrogenase
MNGFFKEKIAVVTGASEGIGLEVARLLAAGGARVVVAARSLDKLKEAAREIPGSVAVRADLREPADRDNLVKEALKRFGRIDIFVNNAGQGIYGPMEKIDLDEYRRVMELNVFAVVDLMQKVIPAMRRQGGGRILNISSMVSKNYYPNLGAYASTKYALNAVSLTARKELEKDGIIVMHPKMTATRFGVNAVGGTPADSRADGKPAPGVDTAAEVAVKVVRQLETGEAESNM